MRYDLKSGAETFAGAAVAGAVRNVVTSHAANPVPRTNWYVDAGLIAGGLLIEGAGVMTRSRALHEMGEGVLAPGFAYAAGDVTQLIRNRMAASATPAQLVLRGGGNPAPQPQAPAYAGGGFVSDY